MSSLFKLVLRVKSYNVSSANSFQQLNELKESIYDEWTKLKNSYKRKLPPCSLKLYIDHEAEEEIIIDLFNVLNEKLINYLA